MIPLVKICGITAPADGVAAAAAGASAIGLVFWPSSPRAVDEARARQIIAAVRDHFNWHNRSIDLGGLKLSGAIALHVLPCLLPLLLLLVRGRIRNVS